MVDVPQDVSRSSMSGAAGQSFDVSDSRDALALLNFIRTTDMDEDLRINLRNTVLDYVQTEDTRILTLLSKLLGDFGVTIVDTTKKDVSVPETRTEKSTLTAKADSAPEENPLTKVEDAPLPPKNIPTSTSEARSAIPDIPDTNEARAAVQEADIDTVAPKTEAEDEPSADLDEIASPQEQTAAAPLPETTQSTQEVQEAGAVPAANPLERIREIKRLMNEKVGNPVNLIDANNEVGREYMNALLNAMKRASGDNQAETKLAMDRLEQAFASVESSIASGETVIAPPAKKAETTKEQSAPDSSTPREEITEPKEQVKETQKDTEADATSSAPMPSPLIPEVMPEEEKNDNPPVAASEPDVELPSTPSHQAPSSIPSVEESLKSALPNFDTEASVSEAKTASLSTTPPSTSVAAEATPVKLRVQSDTPTPPSVPPTPSPQAEPQMRSSAALSIEEEPVSLAEQLKREQEERTSRAESQAKVLNVQENTNTDPLYTNEVSAGLQQLLSEWKLFKSSGLLGTGPSGYEHPLYTKLSALPMAAVISGRFEGVTPEIKQSVADYMNGWRYEQGIVHEMNETFEHYLRRVIKVILDKQNVPKA